jgi:hypothetical protein
MSGPRRIYLFAGLFALAVAGCTDAGVQRAQTSIGDTPRRPKLVLVDDLAFSPGFTVGDRDLDARLEKRFGGEISPETIKSLGAKRVNDEMVATVIVLLRAAGLNAQPGDREENAPKGDTAVVAGQVHALDQGKGAPRKPAGFTASNVVADMTVSQISGGAEKQLLAFTAQAASGRRPDAAITGTIANTAIAAVIGAKSSPDVDLSPDMQGAARGLGRAIADKIVAYGAQQGWQVKAVSAVSAE